MRRKQMIDHLALDTTSAEGLLVQFEELLQCQCLADDLIDIPDDRANDRIECEGPDGKKARVSDDENFRRRKKQVGALQWRLSKLRPKRYGW